jgi:hypothetical protein
MPVIPGGEHGHRFAVIVIALDRGNGQVLLMASFPS